MRRLEIVLLLLFPLTAAAWTPATDERIAQKGAALAPPDLRMLIELFDSDYKQGLARAQSDEGTDSHHYFVLSREGRLRERIERETRGTVDAIRKGEPMNSIVERLGGLVHLIADANNPFHVANDNPRLNASQSISSSTSSAASPVPHRLLRTRSGVPAAVVSRPHVRALGEVLSARGERILSRRHASHFGRVRRPLDRVRRCIDQLLARRHRRREPLLLHLEGSRRRRPRGGRHA
jgi:hypothetical protein